MTVISKLKLERIQSSFINFPFPFICFTLPPEGSLTFSHEISHLLQFKRREISRWLSTGKLVFLTKNEKQYKPRRECETEVIEYKLGKLYASYYLSDTFFREDKGSKRDTYYLNSRKIYNKRLLKKRALYINKCITENIVFIQQKQQALKKVKYYLDTLDTNYIIYQLLYRMFCSINNTYLETFKIPSNEIELTINILKECLIDFISEDLNITVII